MVENCPGCTIDHPSQLQHMDSGCLSEWGESVDHYVDDARNKVNADMMKEACNKIFNHLPFVMDDSIAIKEVQRDDVVEHAIPDDYDILFKDVLM